MKKRRKGRIREFERDRDGKSLEEYRKERQQYAAAQAAPRKKKKVRINRSRIALTVIVLVLIAVVGMSIKNVFDLRAEQQELAATQKKLAREKAALKEELENVNDLEYIEEQARIQLRLIRPGEILYILDDEDKDDNDNDDNQEDQQDQQDQEEDD